MGDSQSEWFAKMASTYEKPETVVLSGKAATFLMEQPWFKPGGSAMDFGAGTGLMTMHILPHFEAVTSLDPSEPMLGVLKAKLERDGVSKVTVTEGPLNTLGKFDFICTVLAFHHIQDVNPIAAELREHLNPGGRLVVIDLEAGPTTRHFHMKQQEIGVHYYHDGFTAEEYQAMFGEGYNDLQLVRMPFEQPFEPGWERPGENEQYNLMFATATAA
mmetsp:Transcript_37724/g.82587  ORF Transcript_37724/g.82587 Transcript_37724/m.82587 type:complete len:216 (-) Transcript_37724:210-857(-)|eukprot:CAMPEP_0204273574 /NCGR_PEP_ID=MMETSP0468-20130131/23752_1 /ASSEMBLY_ACC=CAM_ASM_000383 /TAXON_ID=2969 /ORGANISM="Oxyrrhis marina" /LENGTH=215 /DNA_ID=CAMNT_0051249641 /DNA_START=54 /DNA_END=701 /DNA_ORIENTATION=-